MLLVRQLPAMCIELACRPLMARRTARIPGMSSLYGTAGSRVLSSRSMRFVSRGLVLRTQPQSHIGGEALEQRAGIPRFAFMSFFGLK